jgi:hypothetical protein
MKETLTGLGIIIACISPIFFLFGLIMAIFSKEKKKLGVKFLIGSVIGFIIGFGTCLANFSLGGMH